MAARHESAAGNRETEKTHCICPHKRERAAQISMMMALANQPAEKGERVKKSGA